ncbi:hypothetical protein [Streptomyces sp. SD15]
MTRHQPTGSGSDPAVRDAHRRALEALYRARESAQAPFSIGLTGEMSVGKSLLLGVLLGLPELLPVGEEAVTANVTLIHAKAGDPQLHESYETAVRVEYFSPAQTVGYVRHLRKELADQARAAGLDDTVVRQLEQLPLRDPDCGELIRFRDTYLSGALAQPLAGVLEELRALDAALTRMREYGPSLLGLTAQLGADHARAALVLPGADERRGRDPRTLWTSGDSPRPSASPRPTASSEPSAELLRATLPLIRRVVREVHVAPSVWDLSAFPGAELRFLDFPGLNSDFSSVRDQYVCGAELHSVHSLLILLHAGDGAKDTPQRIVRMWHSARRTDAMEDSVIALISRFHDLRVAETTLKGYLHDDQPLTRERLLSGMKVLRDLLASAERLVTSPRQQTMAPGDRVLFTSAIRALSTGYRTERLSKEFVDKCDLEAQLPKADRLAGIWGDIGRRLTTDPLGGGLDRMLTDFADDGGVRRLRQSLATHVTRHGAALQLAQFTGHRVAAAEALRELHTALDASGDRGRVDHGAETAVRQRLVALLSVWSDVRNRAGAELLDARRLHPGRAGDPPGATLFGELERDTAQRVYTWRSWARLLDTVHDEHVDLRRLHSDPSVPARTEDFFTEFRDACHEAENAGSARLLSAVEAWLLTHQQRVVAAARELGTVVTAEAFDRLRSGPDGDRLVALLSRATSLQWVRDEAEKALRDKEPTQAQTDDGELRDRFPLRPGHLLPWHPDSPFDPVEDAAARHQIAIARQRREMATMVLRQALTGLVRRQRLVVSHLHGEIGAFTTEVRQAALAGALITAVAGVTDRGGSLTGLAEQLRLRAADSVYTWEQSPWSPQDGGPSLWPDATTGRSEHGSVFHIGPDAGGAR